MQPQTAINVLAIASECTTYPPVTEARFSDRLLGLLLSVGAPQRVEAGITTTLECPASGGEVAGTGLIQGWAFSNMVGVQIT